MFLDATARLGRCLCVSAAARRPSSSQTPITFWSEHTPLFHLLLCEARPRGICLCVRTIHYSFLRPPASSQHVPSYQGSSSRRRPRLLPVCLSARTNATTHATTFCACVFVCGHVLCARESVIRTQQSKARVSCRSRRKPKCSGAAFAAWSNTSATTARRSRATMASRPATHETMGTVMWIPNCHMCIGGLAEGCRQAGLSLQ